jgi:hypothetical protein
MVSQIDQVYEMIHRDVTKGGGTFTEADLDIFYENVLRAADFLAFCQEWIDSGCNHLPFAGTLYADDDAADTALGRPEDWTVADELSWLTRTGA